MILEEVQVHNKLGLHARAAARLVRLASSFSSDIYLSKRGEKQQVDSKSILGILMLAAAKGTHIVISIAGQDEREASQAIRALFERKFGEDE